jgi:predicted permease
MISSVYPPILTAVIAGFLLSRLLKSTGRTRAEKVRNQLPNLLSKFLLTVGIPVSIANFIRGAELSANAWIAPATAWVAMLVAIGFSSILLCEDKALRTQTKRSFLLSSYLGNTSNIGFPVVLLLPQLGEYYFGYAVVYDIFGTILGAYGLGAWIANRGRERQTESAKSIANNIASLLVKSPSLIAFAIGILLKSVALPDPVIWSLNTFSWSCIMLSLLTMGMRTEQLTSRGDLSLAIKAVSIKMLAVPLIIGALLTAFGIDGPERLTLVLQAGMPCAFAALVLTENFGLDRNLAVKCLLISNIMLLITLPIWVFLFLSW